MSISANYPALRPALLLDFANSQQLDPRITFSRSTTAPYYDGKTSVLAEQNLLLYSQGNFTQAYWNKQNVTVTDNTVIAPDGTTTASTLTTSVGLANHNIVVTGTYAGTIAGTYTESWFIKPNTSNFVTVFVAYISGQWVCATANLSTVAITQTGSSGASTYVSSSITASTNGYYRITLTYNISSASGMLSGVQINSSATPTYGSFGLESWTALGTESVYIWGAQLEQRSSATAYNATTTTPITNYIPQLLTAPINAPRFDFNPTTGESLGLLIEQSSTNLFNYSEQFNNAYWNAGNSTVSANQIIAPDGNQTGDLWTCTAGSARHYFIAGTTTTGSYSCSVYLKKGTNQYFQIASGGGGFSANFDIGLGVVGTTSGANILSSSITLVGNGWYRCVVTFTAATENMWLLQVNSASASALQSFTATGYETMFIWGAQLEALAFPTSYIPTTSAQVTRASDNASMTGTNFSSWYNNGQGTLYVEQMGTLLNGVTNNTIGFALNNVQAIGFNQVSATSRFFVGSTTITTSVGVSSMAFYKVIGSYNFNNTIASECGNGGTVYSATVSAQTADSLKLPIYMLTGLWIKKLAYYPQALTSTQLQSLTGS